MPRAEAINHQLLADLAKRLGTDDVLRWLEEQTASLARLGWKKPGHVELGSRLLGAAGVSACVGDLKTAEAAQIEPDGAGTYRIRYHYFSPQVNQRFWIAHEIVHTFWFRKGGRGEALSRCQRVLGSDPTIEWLCNRGAAALLVPRGALESLAIRDGYRLNDTPLPIHLLTSFAQRLRVHPRLLARRWFHEILDEPENIICLMPADDRSATGDTRFRYRVVWEAIYSPRMKAPKKLQGRVVPREAVPSELAQHARPATIDGRWRTMAAQAKSTIARAESFTRIPTRPEIQGVASRQGHSVLLAFRG
jgi:hypothetical protein